MRPGSPPGALKRSRTESTDAGGGPSNDHTSLRLRTPLSPSGHLPPDRSSQSESYRLAPETEQRWVAKHENVFVCGPTGVGKSYLACALAHKACRDGYSAFYTRAAALFRDLALARTDGSLRNFLLRLSKLNVLVVDDWAMTPMGETERRDFWEICGDRCQSSSLVLTSQVPVAKWHEQIGDATVAEGILDRIVHRAHRIELRGESLRKNPPKSKGPGQAS